MSNASDSWLLLLEFMQFVNITMPLQTCEGACLRDDRRSPRAA